MRVLLVVLFVRIQQSRLYFAVATFCVFYLFFSPPPPSSFCVRQPVGGLSFQTLARIFHFHFKRTKEYEAE